MAVIGNLLFWSGQSRPTLSDVLRHNLETEVPQKVERLTESQLIGGSDEALAASLVEECQAEPLVLKLDEADVDVREISVDVQDHFGGRAMVPGLRATKIVPFEGEAHFLSMTPNSFDMNPPRGEVRGNKLVVGMEIRESESEAAERHINETLTSVQTNIDRQRSEIDAHNAQLPGVIGAAIQRRRGSLEKASDLAARLRGQ